MEQPVYPDPFSLAEASRDDCDGWPNDEALLDITQMALRDILGDLEYLSARHLAARPTRTVIKLALALLQGNEQAARKALAATHAALRLYSDPAAAPHVAAA